MTSKPSRSEVWTVNLNPTRGREQRGLRPALVISVNEFNHGPADLVTVIPLTGTDRGIPFHTRVDPPEGGLTKSSFILCDQSRTISRDRLENRLGSIGAETMAKVEDNLKVLLGL